MIKHGAHDALLGKSENIGSGALGMNTPELAGLHHHEERGYLQYLHFQGEGTLVKASSRKGRGCSYGKASRRCI
jgi:hypothetical protein